MLSEHTVVVRKKVRGILSLSLTHTSAEYIIGLVHSYTGPPVEPRRDGAGAAAGDCVRNLGQRPILTGRLSR